MAIWIYSAAKTYASAAETYRLAAEHGLIWRSFHEDREPTLGPKRIPNVQYLRAGDTVYLGYRDEGQVRLLGRMIVGEPDEPLDCSPVFCAVPPTLEPLFFDGGYEVDPVLRRIVGIFVKQVEPVVGSISSPGRFTIVELDEDPLGEAPPSQHRPALVVAPFIPDVPSAPAVPPNPRPTASNGVHLGIDVGGARKGMHFCNLRYGSDGIEQIGFEQLRYAVEMPSTATLRPLVRGGDLHRLASVTYHAVRQTAAQVWHRVSAINPTGIYTDVPSGFSRNRSGHGRLVEKVSYRGVWFQCTPSICCDREHGGEWNWLIYGMSAFMAVLHRGGDFSLDDWTTALVGGLHRPTKMVPGLTIRECFPTATVSKLRTHGRAAEVIALLEPHEADDAGVTAAITYLRGGVFGNKGRTPTYDFADALIAALSSLPHVYPDRFRESEPVPQTPCRWSAEQPDSVTEEGRIALVE